MDLIKFMNQQKSKQFKQACKYIQEIIFKNKKDLPEEIADTAIYLFGLASILKIDLGREIIKKISKNKNRKYVKTRGVLIKK